VSVHDRVLYVKVFVAVQIICKYASAQIIPVNPPLLSSRSRHSSRESTDSFQDETVVGPMTLNVGKSYSIQCYHYMDTSSMLL
jgi:hypothetical protein